MKIRLESKDGKSARTAEKHLDYVQERLLSQIRPWIKQQQEHPERFGELEKKIHLAFAELADLTAATVLKEATEASPKLEEAKKKVIAEAAGKVRAPEKRWLQIRLLGGRMFWVQTDYCGPAARTGKGRQKEGTGIYPELGVLGFSEGSSPGLAELVARLTALLPSYELAQAELAQRGIFLDIKVVHGISQQLGAEILATRTGQLQQFRAGTLPAGTELKGKRVAAAVDGGRIRIRKQTRKQKGKGKHKKQRRRYRAEWREPKVLIIFEIDKQGRMVRRHAWIDGTFGGPDETMELLAMHLHRLGAAQASEVVFLSDGAPWIWERWAWVAKRLGLDSAKTKYVLDFCHAAHHVSLALQPLALEAKERQRLYKKFRKWMRSGRTNRVVKELRELAQNQPQDSEVWTAIDYLAKHSEQHHVDYALLRQCGLPLGSGAIESAIRRVINLRIKGNSLMWLEENAEAMLVLRAAILTQRFEEIMTKVRQRMARNRRLAWKWTSPDMREQLKTGGPADPQKSQDEDSKEVVKPAA